MSSNEHRTPTDIRSEREPDDSRGTVQLLVADTGNRTVIQGMLDDYFEVETSQTVRDADLYLIEDHLFSEYQETLRERVEQAHPTFCPVVLIRRGTTELAHPAEDTAFDEGPILIDDVVDAPINRALLIRRLHSLLVRHRQSQELSSYVSTLEAREQELRRFERGVDSTGNGIVMTDRLGEIEYVNPAVEEITGYTDSEVLGETARILQPAGAADVFTEEFWQTMINRKEWAGEVVLEHSDETRSVVDTSITAIDDESGDVEGFVLVLNDITERIQQEKQLQNREQELDLLRQILTRYLRHNLRNDLNVILGYGEMLATDDTLSESQTQMAGKIVETAQRLQETGDTARQFSTLLQQDTALSLYDLSEVVNECVQTISEQYPDVRFEIDVPSSCEIRARLGVQDAVQELIENAAKHNDADSPHVQVQLRCSFGARLHIEDNGPGISDLELGTLEVGEETPLLHSQGVGLWLSKWIIESNHGQLSFDQVDPGTRVTVEFSPPERVGSEELDVPALKERDQRLQTVLDRMINAVVEVNDAWEITFVDARAEEILDISAEEIQGKNFWDVFSDTLDTQFEVVYRDAMESRTSQHVEAYYPGIDGWLSVYVYPEFDGGVSFYFRETTERNEQRQALEQAQSRMELALEVTDAAVWEWDRETNAATIHPERHPVLDTTIQTGDDFIEGIHPDDRARVQDALETAVETRSAFDVEYRVQNGEIIRWAADHGEVRPRKDGDGHRIVGVARDITDRKQREQELDQTRELLERTEQLAEVGGWEIDTDTMDVFWSENLFDILGVEDDEEPPLDEALDVYHKDDRPIVEKAVENALNSGEPFDVEARFRRPDGEIGWLRIQGVPTTDDDEVVTLRGAIQEITEYKQREQEREELIRDLEQSEERLQLALAAGEMGMWELDLQSNETLVHTLEHDRIFGYESPVEDWGFDRFLEHVHPADRDRVQDLFDEASETGRVEFECRIHRADGALRWISAQGEFYFDSTGMPDYAIGVVEDITERKQSERSLEERVKELTILQDTAQRLLRSDGSLDEVFTDFIRSVPQSFQYPEIAAAKITYKDHEASTDNFEYTESCLTAQTETETNGRVQIEVVYLEERLPEDDGSFLTEEQELLDALVALIANQVERWEYMQQLERQNE